MPLELWLSFCLASLLIIVSPGPAVALLVTTGINRGRRAALAMLPGFFLGDLLAMTLSFAGVGALLMASAELFQLFKWLGAAYLLYLGIKMWREAGRLGDLQPTGTDIRVGTAKAFLVTALNPKSLAFFMAFMPQFVTPSQPLLPQLAILFSTFLVIGVLSDLAFTFLATTGGRMLSARFRRILHRAGAGSLIGASALVAAMRRP
ncbi:LysE family translocator [Halomonas mongoliensis]|jgi:threonine/homoserine/homoserine lactone efflux protein|uniref:LysE family translocator n=1 Tax=Halomonas mongoliensis TaxID=321265 RepID=A0ABU1GJ85_9GAMM|nr:LysE family translocator [Halomonas mongoliensis]MCL4553442.1 LysE family translocator [Candidatus Marsarchaeota archaeon]MDR5892084.1 LysE family translocator [Halomonas mongoliensis]